MPLTNWLTNWLAKPNRAARRARKAAAPRKPRPLVVEALEDRVVPRTTLFIDFGIGLNPATATVTTDQLRDIDHAPDGTPVAETGPNFPLLAAKLAALGIDGGAPAGSDITLQKLAFDYNGMAAPTTTTSNRSKTW